MKEHAKEIIRLGAAAILLAAAETIRHFCPYIPLPVMIGLYFLPYVAAGFEVFSEIPEKIKSGDWLDECFLMTVATVGAFAIGEYTEAVCVMIFYGIGELFEEMAGDRSRKGVEELLKLKPSTVIREIPGGTEKVLPAAVSVGEVILVPPGERIPLDGTVLRGESALDTSALTGESMPMPVFPGKSVSSGCINLSGLLALRVTETEKDSTVSRILDLMENVSEGKSAPERFITAFSKIYTPAVCAAALIIAVLGSIFGGNPGEWIRRGLMFLVISCPCALVVSVPMTYFCSMGRAAVNGVLIKDAASLEQLSKVGEAVFDKTGTLTRGVYQVVAVHPHDLSEADLLELAALADGCSNHPAAHALRKAYGKEPDLSRVSRVSENGGKGVAATVDGHRILVGSTRLMNENGIAARNCELEGTVVHVASDGKYCGHVIISDTLKEDAAGTVRSVKSRGIHTAMLTGDKKQTAEKIAEETGIETVFAELLPGEKVERLQTLRKELPPEKAVLFIGDGLNDAPVLAAADVGVAIGTFGSAAAAEAADVVLMDDRLEKLSGALNLGNKTARRVRENVLLILGIKALVLVLCALGIADLWLAAFSDVGILVLAVLNALRKMNF